MIVAFVTELITGDGMNAITELITGVGFPIACCVVLFKQNSELQKVLTNLSNTLTSLNDRVGRIESKLDEEEE